MTKEFTPSDLLNSDEARIEAVRMLLLVNGYINLGNTKVPVPSPGGGNNYFSGSAEDAVIRHFTNLGYWWQVELQGIDELTYIYAFNPNPPEEE